MHFESEFLLTREYFAECYDQSQPFSKNRTPRIKFMALLVIAGGLILLFAEQKNSLAFFLIALAFVEYFSFRYRRAWWLLRQVWSRNSGNTIKLIIDDNGIQIESAYNNQKLLWKDVIKLDETEKGLLLTLPKGQQNYLSKATLNEEVVEFIKAKISTSLEVS